MHMNELAKVTCLLLMSLVAGCGASGSGGDTSDPIMDNPDPDPDPDPDPEIETPLATATLTIRSDDLGDGVWGFYPRESGRHQVGISRPNPPTRGGTRTSFSTLREDTPAPAGFGYYDRGSNRMFRGVTSERHGQVFVSNVGTQLERLGETTLPTAGSVTYDGTYASLIINPTSTPSPNRVLNEVYGDVRIDVSFDANTVTGEITNRDVKFVGVELDDFGDPLPGASENAADIALQGGTLENGVFTGVTSGGSLAGFTALDGTFKGIVVGPNGEEVVGEVRITHDTSGSFGDRVEIGGFVGESSN